MQKTHLEDKPTEVVDDIICNKCGQSCCTAEGPDYGFEGLLGVRVDVGYSSKHLGDLERYEFDVCEKCLVEWFATFTINPHKGEYFRGV
jgi:hypothetical protein